MGLYVVVARCLNEKTWQVEEEFCDLLGTIDSTGRGSLCYNGECWAVSLVRHYEPILETLTVTHRYLRRERLPIFPYICQIKRSAENFFLKHANEYSLLEALVIKRLITWGLKCDKKFPGGM